MIGGEARPRDGAAILDDADQCAETLDLHDGIAVERAIAIHVGRRDEKFGLVPPLPEVEMQLGERDFLLELQAFAANRDGIFFSQQIAVFFKVALVLIESPAPAPTAAAESPAPANCTRLPPLSPQPRIRTPNNPIKISFFTICIYKSFIMQI